MEADRANPSSSFHAPLQAAHAVDSGNTDRPITKKDVIIEAKLQFFLAVPLIHVNLFIFRMQIVTVMFVGHLSVTALVGAALGYSFVTVTGITVIIAMSSALDTLCGQTYDAKQHRLVGIHMQRSILVHLVTRILLSAVWANTGRILKAAGQNEEIAQAAGVYALYLIPSVFGYAILQNLVKFLQTRVTQCGAGKNRHAEMPNKHHRHNLHPEDEQVDEDERNGQEKLQLGFDDDIFLSDRSVCVAGVHRVSGLQRRTEGRR